MKYYQHVLALHYALAVCFASTLTPLLLKTIHKRYSVHKRCAYRAVHCTKLVVLWTLTTNQLSALYFSKVFDFHFSAVAACRFLAVFICESDSLIKLWAVFFLRSFFYTNAALPLKSRWLVNINCIIFSLYLLSFSKKVIGKTKWFSLKNCFVWIPTIDLNFGLWFTMYEMNTYIFQLLCLRGVKDLWSNYTNKWIIHIQRFVKFYSEMYYRSN